MSTPTPLDLEHYTPATAVELQNQLRQRVVTQDRLGPVERVAGLDVGFIDRGRVTRAAVVVLSFPELELVESTRAFRPTCFPYIPGLLSFRELPALIDAVKDLSRPPDLLLCDGQGIAHPRRLGIASHLGIALDIPSIGVAKTRLCGTYGTVPEARGAWTPLCDGKETIGAVLRTRAGTKPLFVSSGHRIALNTAIRHVMACCTRYRLPETTRHAHRLASIAP
ncbi:MAG: deoxyribonuclease V [Gammaproteobacteria bacterium]|nr:deoxyribonuclease V [Gammaproteobacteria bacterium]MCP5458037.1 deoxyribonuclease V [Gammaproteobacteria bacterium]